MANSSDPAKTYTLDQFIEMKSIDSITYYNFSILQKIDDVEHLDHNLLEDYLDELKSVCVNITLSTEEFKRYRYAPDRLAYDLFGTVQLDCVILMLNDMFDPKEFTKKNIILPYASALSTFLNAVYSKESNYIEYNRNNLSNE